MELTANKTEWNGGTFTNLRIHTIKEELRMTAVTNDINTWRTLLVQLNHELYGFQDKTEQTKLRTDLENLAVEINEYTRTQKYSRGRTQGIPSTIIDKLNEIQYTLDEIFHRSGLQTALADDAGDAF